MDKPLPFIIEEMASKRPYHKCYKIDVSINDLGWIHLDLKNGFTLTMPRNQASDLVEDIINAVESLRSGVRK